MVGILSSRAEFGRIGSASAGFETQRVGTSTLQ